MAASFSIIVACGSSSSSSSSDANGDAATGVDDASVAAATDARAASSPPFPILPYPPGPYGVGTGDVMPDVRMPGYALSREHHDSTRLPFRDVSLAEVRSDPACTCLIIEWNAAGNNCSPCVDGDAALAAAISNDATMCGLEIIEFSYDTKEQGQTFGEQPPTRADLDAFTQSGRESFPVVLVNDDAQKKLGGTAFPGVPSFYFVRPSDMRVVGVLGGRPDDFHGTARSICTTPQVPTEVLVKAKNPQRLAISGTHVYFSDGADGVLRIPLNGGVVMPELLAKPTTPPDAIAVYGSNVYWATHKSTGGDGDGGGGVASFEIAKLAIDESSAPDAGSPSSPLPITLASSSHGYSSMAAEDGYMYFTRDDGAIGKAPLSGAGPETPIFTDELAPGSIAVDASDLYWIAANGTAIVKASKNGGSGGTRTTLVSAVTGDRFSQLTLTNLSVIYSGREGVFMVPKIGGSPAPIARVPSPSVFGLGPVQNTVVLSMVDEGYPDLSSVGSLALRASPTSGFNANVTIHTLGQAGLRSIAVDFDYMYWTRSGPNGGAIVRQHR